MTYPSEKHEFVSWDDDIPKMWKVKKKPWFQTTKQHRSLYTPLGPRYALLDVDGPTPDPQTSDGDRSYIHKLGPIGLWSFNIAKKSGDLVRCSGI